MTSKQRAYLKSIASTTETILHVGKSSATPEFTKSIDEALEARELIKMSVLETCPITSRQAADELAIKVKADVVQVIGRKFILYRESKNNKN